MMSMPTLQDNNLDNNQITLEPWTWYNSSGLIKYKKKDLNVWNTANSSIVITLPLPGYQVQLPVT